MTPFEISMEARTTLIEDATALFGDAGHVAVEGDDFVTVMLTYRATTKDGATAHVREQTEVGAHFRIFTGEWDTVWDGAAMVNLGTLPAHIELIAFDGTGEEIYRSTLDDGLAPDAKLLVSFAAELPAETARIEIVSTESLSTAFLRGANTGKAQLLFQTDPLIDRD